MDAVNFGITVASIVGAFNACVRLYGDILSIRDRDEDVRACRMLLQIEQCTFHKLHVAMEQGAHLIPQANALCKEILEWMRDDLERLLDLCSRHASVDAAPPATAGLLSNVEGTFRERRSGEVNNKMDRNVTAFKRMMRTVTWVASDKQRLKDLAARVHQWNDGLATLLPEATRQRISYETLSTSIANDSLEMLEHVENAASGYHPAIARGAEVRKLSLRSHVTLSSPDRTLLEKGRFKLALDCLQWLPLSSTEKNTGQSPDRNSIDVSTASALERAFAVYRRKQAGIGNGLLDPGLEATRVIVEWRDSFRSEESLKQFEYRLDYLVTILQKMAGGERGQTLDRSGQSFSMFTCFGWVTTSPTFDRIGLVFQLPREMAGLKMLQEIRSALPALSLHEWITQTRRERSNTPALGRRFALAQALALTLGNLVSVGWVHKEFRSHNILFLRDADANSPADGIPYLSGFTYARPSSGSDRDLSLLMSDPAYDMYRPSQHVMFQHQERRVMQHQERRIMHQQEAAPSAQGAGSKDSIDDHDKSMRETDAGVLRWTSAMDIYGLGIVMLEIGLWRTIQSLKGDQVSKTDFVSRVLGSLVDSLSSRMGDLYMGVVKKCLKLGEWLDSDDGVREFFAESIEMLSLCRA